MKITLIILWTILVSWTTSYSQDKNSIIRFNDLIVTIKPLETFDKEQLDKVFDGDAIFWADLGEYLESADIIIETEKYKNIEIFQAFETSVTIMNEGPHCDLVNWKHYTSEWEKLKEIKPKTYQTIVYPENESKKFPTVTIKEVQEAARKQCGDDWVDLIKDVKSIYDYPCDVGVSRYFLKIKGTHNTTGTKIEKKITILIPMGC